MNRFLMKTSVLVVVVVIVIGTIGMRTGTKMEPVGPQLEIVHHNAFATAQRLSAAKAAELAYPKRPEFGSASTGDDAKANSCENVELLIHQNYVAARTGDDAEANSGENIELLIHQNYVAASSGDGAEANSCENVELLIHQNYVTARSGD